MLNRSQLLLLLWAGTAVSVSLSHYEKITNVPNTCFSIWNKQIPECKRTDFSGSGCSLLCFAGLNVIDAEVQAECADVDASIQSLLGKFLAGEGPSTMCDGGAESAKTLTSTSTSTSTSQTTKAPHRSADTHTIQPITATVAQTTAAPVSTEATQSTTSVSFFSSSSTSTTTSASSTTTADTTTAQHADRTTSAATSSSSPTSNPDAKGFGGVGDAYDILGGHSSAGQLETPWTSLVVAVICAVSMGSVL